MRTAAILGLAAILAAAAGEGRAQERTDPYWAQPVRPDLAERLYPGFAVLLGESGRVTVVCPVEDDGHPYLCEVVDEAPRGLGFGAAARVMVASAEIGAARVDGVVVPRTVRTTVRFHMAGADVPFGGWTGPEPTPAALKLAREMIEEAPPEDMPRPYRETMMDGLDYDRQQVVAPWVDELLPRDEAREKEVLAIQMARLFDEATMRRIRSGESVDWPSKEQIYAACPDPTPAELAAMEEIRRRYCDRYECGVDPMGAAR